MKIYPFSAKRHRGFTLIELIVALAIVGIALAIVPASVSSYRERMEYQRAVRDLTSGLKAARVEATRSGKPRFFLVDTNTGEYSIDDRRLGRVADSIKLGLVTGKLGEEEKGSSGSILFFPGGGATGGSLYVRREAGGGVRLRVDWLMGRVTQEPIE